jgi:hypothetical protein
MIAHDWQSPPNSDNSRHQNELVKTCFEPSGFAVIRWWRTCIFLIEPRVLSAVDSASWCIPLRQGHAQGSLWFRDGIMPGEDARADLVIGIGRADI